MEQEPNKLLIGGIVLLKIDASRKQWPMAKVV